jgi:hypothetical protein
MRVWTVIILVWIACVAVQGVVGVIAAAGFLALGAQGPLGSLLAIYVAYLLVGILAFWIAFLASKKRWKLATIWSTSATAAAVLGYFLFVAFNSVLIVNGTPMYASGRIYPAFIPLAIENAAYCSLMIAVGIWGPLRLGGLVVGRYAKTDCGGLP